MAKIYDESATGASMNILSFAEGDDKGSVEAPGVIVWASAVSCFMLKEFFMCLS